MGVAAADGGELVHVGGTAVSEREAVFCEVRVERGEAAGFLFQREKEMVGPAAVWRRRKW